MDFFGRNFFSPNCSQKLLLETNLHIEKFVKKFCKENLFKKLKIFKKLFAKKFPRKIYGEKICKILFCEKIKKLQKN